MLQAGDPAPAFELPDADMTSVDLASLSGKTVVLYFYLRNGMPACTAEAIEFSDLDEEFRRLNCVVLGVSKDDCLSHADFRDQHGLAITLLSDSDGEACAAYQVLQEKLREGTERKFCVLRSTFIIDGQGTLRHAMYGVNPRGHAAETLELVKELLTGN